MFTWIENILNIIQTVSRDTAAPKEVWLSPPISDVGPKFRTQIRKVMVKNLLIRSQKVKIFPY